MPVQCPDCGRFARFVSTRNHYNGEFVLTFMTTNCKQCGLRETDVGA